MWLFLTCPAPSLFPLPEHWHPLTCLWVLLLNTFQMRNWCQLLCSDLSLNFTGCSLGILFIGNHGECSPFLRVGECGKRKASNSNAPRCLQEVSLVFLYNFSVDPPSSGGVRIKCPSDLLHCLCFSPGWSSHQYLCLFSQEEAPCKG